MECLKEVMHIWNRDDILKNKPSLFVEQPIFISDQTYGLFFYQNKLYKLLFLMFFIKRVIKKVVPQIFEIEKKDGV
jgi:hypothetical protein